jgi:hypothetical protein
MKTAIKRFLLLGVSLYRALLGRCRDGQSELFGNSSVESPKDARPEPSSANQLHATASPGPQPSSASVVTISGTIVRSGSRFALREKEGAVYPLDSIGRAWTFEGEDVRVTGKLDGSTHMLHIDEIESLVA